MKRNNDKIMSLNQFKKAGRLDRLYFHMMQPDQLELNSRESEYLEKLKRVFAIMAIELDTGKVVTKVQNLFPDAGTTRHIYRLINDVKNLFGDVIERNKAFEREVLKAKFIHVAKKASKEKDLETERRCYLNIMRLMGLDEQDGNGFNPEDIELPDLHFTDNPKAIAGEFDEFEEIE